MGLDNRHLVVILGEDDFASHLSARINRTWVELGEAPIANSLTAQNDGQLGQTITYCSRHPTSRITVLHARVYPDSLLRPTVVGLKNLGQKIILVASRNKGQTLESIEALSQVLGVQATVLETNSDLVRDVRLAIVQLLGKESRYDYELPKGSSVASPPLIGSPAAAEVRTETNSGAGNEQSSVSLIRPPSRVAAGCVPSPKPVPALTPPRTTIATPHLVPHSRRRDSLMNDHPITPAPHPEVMGETGQAIETTFAQLRQRARDNLIQLRNAARELHETVVGLKQLEERSVTLRATIEADLASLPADILSATDQGGSDEDSTGQGQSEHPSWPSANSASHHRTSETATRQRHQLGSDCEVVITGKNTNRLFTLLLERSQNGGGAYSRQELESLLGLEKQALYQTMHVLRGQLHDSLGGLIDQCLLSGQGKGYRWDSAPLASAAKTGT